VGMVVVAAVVELRCWLPWLLLLLLCPLRAWFMS